MFFSCRLLIDAVNAAYQVKASSTFYEWKKGKNLDCRITFLTLFFSLVSFALSLRFHSHSLVHTWYSIIPKQRIMNELRTF